MAPSIHAVFPGTFDPITLGHLDVVRRALRLFDRVTVGVAQHHDKRQLLTAEERLELVREVLVPFERAEARPLDGLLVEGVRALGAQVVVRGVRGASDLEYERQMALTNRAMDPELETVFVLPAPELAHVSSTLVRQIAGLGGDLTPFVPPQVAAFLAKR
jgi:pantetheine-phosphate adenylyltransferase